MFQHTAARRRLPIHQFFNWAITCFNTQPPEGGCPRFKRILNVNGQVSTHSRPKAAASNLSMVGDDYNKFQHTAARRRLLHESLLSTTKQARFQHTAARRRLRDNPLFKNAPIKVSTHSRPKAAAFVQHSLRLRQPGFNTQPPEGGCQIIILITC